MLRTIRPFTQLQSTAQRTFRSQMVNPTNSSIFTRSCMAFEGGHQGRNLLGKSAFVSWSGPTKMIGAVAATTGTMMTGLWMKRPLSCQGAQMQISGVDSFKAPTTKDKEPSKSLIHPGEMSFGIVLGFCSGYLIKKVGKLFLLMIGVGFMFLQYLSFNDFVTIHWDRLEGGYNRKMGVDKNGKVTTQAVRSKWNSFAGFMTHNLQFKSTFMIGVYSGLRYG